MIRLGLSGTGKYLLLGLLLAGLLVSVTVLDSNYRGSREAVMVEKFRLLGQLRRSALETYFSTVEAEISFWSVSPKIRDSFAAIRNGWGQLGDRAPMVVRGLYISDYPFAGTGLAELIDAGDGSAYSKAHADLQAGQ